MVRFFRTPTGRLALGSLMAAGSLVLLMMACTIPTGQIGMTALAGLCPMIGVLTAGSGAGFLSWAAGALLGLLLLPNKGIALLYAMFFGIYPVLKERIEALRKLPLEWLLKLAVCNLILLVVLFVFRGLFLPILPGWRFEIVYFVGNVAFIIYDLGLSQVIDVLRRRLRLN